MNVKCAMKWPCWRATLGVIKLLPIKILLGIFIAILVVISSNRQNDKSEIGEMWHCTCIGFDVDK